jgi:phospholipase/lecithinase/hemolysin
MLRITLSLLITLLTGCTYDGPQVADYLPEGQSAWLAQEVANPASGAINHLVVFGDSLSDPGNLSRNTFGFVVPHSIFYQGHFSNGPIWADYVENALHWSVDNYAVGGARTHPSPFPSNLVIPSLAQQIDESLGRLKQLEANKTLIALWIGPNNYLRNDWAYQDAHGEPKTKLLTQAVAQTISDIEGQIYRLEKLGFQHIVIGSMPELGGINRDPKDSSPYSDATLYMATRLHNQALHLMLERITAKHSQLKLITYQAYSINKATYDNPSAYGFSRLDSPCFVGSVYGEFYAEQTFCSDPMGYKFWEYIHPNTRMQCYYASQFLSDIAQGGLIDGYHQERAVARCLAIKNKA